MYYVCYDMVYDDICENSKKDQTTLQNKLYIIEKILNENIIHKYDQPYILIPLFYFLYHVVEKKDTDFILNMIESKSLNDKELKKKLLKYNGILIKDDKKSLFNK